MCSYFFSGDCSPTMKTEEGLTAAENENKLWMVVKQLYEHIRKQNKKMVHPWKPIFVKLSETTKWQFD